MASSDQDSGSDVQQSVENLCQLVAEMPESDIPEYISEAAEHISAALSYEAEEQFEASLSSYRSAIGKLLSCVQTDPDTARQAQVKRRIAQYISKAEQIGKVFYFVFLFLLSVSTLFILYNFLLRCL